VPTRPANEAAMPATAFSILFLCIGYAALLWTPKWT
jgi:hypothetical protein